MLKKIADILKSKRGKILIAIGIILIAVVIVFIIFNMKEKEDKIDSTKYLIDAPTQYNQSHSTVISPTLYANTTFPNSLEVYKIEEVDHSTTIDKFLIKIGKTGYEKSEIGQSLYTWLNGDNIVDYTPYNQELKYKFTSPFRTTLNTQFIDEDAVNSFFKQYMNEYFGVAYEYTNGRSTIQGREIRIEASRQVADYPIYLPNQNSYTDYLVVDDRGNVYEGKHSIFEFNIIDNDSIDLVRVENLSRLLNNSSYPKDIFQGYSEDLKNILTQPDVEPIDAADHLTLLPFPVYSDTSKVELVYYYSDNSIKYIIPIYRLEATGIITYQGRNARVPLVIFANALNPERVYVRGE